MSALFLLERFPIWLCCMSPQDCSLLGNLILCKLNAKSFVAQWHYPFQSLTPTCKHQKKKVIVVVRLFLNYAFNYSFIYIWVNFISQLDDFSCTNCLVPLFMWLTILKMPASKIYTVNVLIGRVFLWWNLSLLTLCFLETQCILGKAL